MNQSTLPTGGRKFVMSYSCGKDSTLALHKMIAAGNVPVALIVMVNKNMDRSFFHGADRAMLNRYSEALDIPMIEAETDGMDYHIKMEAALKESIAMGADLACFGDIDIEGNRLWSEERCKNAGIDTVFPLWHIGREDNVRELLSLGYKCLIKSINNSLLPKSILGKTMDDEVISVMEQAKIDICGENGEYHTLVLNGPVFKQPVNLKAGEILDFGDYSVIDVTL